MRRISLFGTLSDQIAENTAAWEWLGQLRLSFDPAQIRFVDLQGTGADYFDVSLNRGLGTLVVTPFARPDFEAFARSETAPQMSFSIRFFMADGSMAESDLEYRVQVLDVDDTPPQSLSFASGGRVAANTPGAVIGTLAVIDPDTAPGQFRFTLPEDERWMFEVVDQTLRLKPGVMLTDFDGPVRILTVEVSDGRQSSAFQLAIPVMNPAIPGAPALDTLDPGEARLGFSWRGTTLTGSMISADLAVIRDAGDYLNLSLRKGGDVWVAQPAQVDLVDGSIFYAPGLRLGRLWNMYETIFNRDPTHRVMAILDEAGTRMDDVQILREFIGGAGWGQRMAKLSNAEFLRELYMNAVGEIEMNGYPLYLASLAAGTPREYIALDFVNWRASVGHEAQRLEKGIFVPQVLGQQVDTLLRIGLGIEASDVTRHFTQQIAAGAVTLRDLAEGVGSHPLLQQKYAGQNTWEFVWNFWSNATGQPPSTPELIWWAERILVGDLSKGFFLEALARSPTAASYVFREPEGTPFDSIW